MRTTSSHLKHSLAWMSVASLLWIGSPASAQSTPTQNPQATPMQGRDNDTTTRELGKFDSYLDAHPVLAEQIRKDPSLLKNQQFLEKHSDLQQYLQQNPTMQEEINENPAAFMRQERQFDRRETRIELTNLDAFLDSHPEIAEQLRKNPELVNDKQFVKNHPALQEFLQAHGGAAQDMRQNPSGFMQEEQRFEQREDGRDRDMARGDRDMTRGQMASMDRFLDSHPEIAEQLRKNSSLVNDKKFVHQHPALQSYLQQNPGVREEFRENPNAFMQQEQRFDRREDRFNQTGNRFDQRQDGRDRDVTRAQLASMDRFLDSHPEVAEQLRKNPSLVNDQKFVQQHPALHSYLQQNPGVREEVGENPNAFMRQEQRFDRHEDYRQESFGRQEGFEARNNGGFDREGSRGEAAHFGAFLGAHGTIAAQVSKDPSLLNNKEYMENHPELQAYLKAHPAAQAQLQQNPQAFMQSAQPVSKPAPKAPTVAKPAQKQQ